MDDRIYCSTDVWNRKVWQNQKGEYHRLDGPAIESSNGGKEWWEYGKLHRLNGPAIIYSNGEKEWYKNGYRFESKEKFFESLTEEEKVLALFSEDFLNG